MEKDYLSPPWPVCLAGRHCTCEGVFLLTRYPATTMSMLMYHSLMKYLSLQVWFIMFLWVNLLYAEETPEDVAQRAYLTNVNALMVFTSQEGLNSGRYRFGNIGIKMDIYHLPFIYHLDAGGKTFNMFVMGNVGYSSASVNESITISDYPNLSHENQMSTYTGGVGFGIRYKTPYEIDLLTGIELIYSRSGINVYKPDNKIGAAVEKFFKGKYNDNLTYKFLAQLEHHKEINDYTLYGILSYKLYETKANFNFDALTSFTTQSGVTSLGAGIESPKLFTYGEMYLTLEGYIYGHYLSGDIVDVVDFETYSTVGTVFYWYTEDQPDWAERFFIELSTVKSNGLEGFNLGIGFTLDF